MNGKLIDLIRWLLRLRRVYWHIIRRKLWHILCRSYRCSGVHKSPFHICQSKAFRTSWQHAKSHLNVNARCWVTLWWSAPCRSATSRNRRQCFSNIVGYLRRRVKYGLKMKRIVDACLVSARKIVLHRNSRIASAMIFILKDVMIQSTLSNSHVNDQIRLRSIELWLPTTPNAVRIWKYRKANKDMY